jgi:signal transduction histidine kinase
MREIFRDIVENDARAADVLEHIRILLRKEPPASAPVDLNRVCSEAIRLLEHDAELRGVRLRLALAPTLPDVTGDAVQLQQVVLNLARNGIDAVKVSESSRRDHEVVVGTAAQNGVVEIFVRDTGPGLAPDVRQRIFEPFYSTKSHGLGMGLAIVRTIIERHRGQVSVENQETGGAVFTVQLPSTDRGSLQDQ